MKIVDLAGFKEHTHDYFVCLEEWYDPFEESIGHKREWYEKMKDRGLGVKLALDDDGVVGGMIQYVPVEESVIDGEGLFFIQCIWVHRREVGRGNRQGKGLGTEMLKAVEEDIRTRGAKGVAAWGVSFDGWMEAGRVFI